MFAQEDICSGRFNWTTIYQPFERKKLAFLKKRIEKRREIITTFFIELVAATGAAAIVFTTVASAAARTTAAATWVECAGDNHVYRFQHLVQLLVSIHVFHDYFVCLHLIFKLGQLCFFIFIQLIVWNACIDGLHLNLLIAFNDFTCGKVD